MAEYTVTGRRTFIGGNRRYAYGTFVADSTANNWIETGLSRVEMVKFRSHTAAASPGIICAPNSHTVGSTNVQGEGGHVVLVGATLTNGAGYFYEAEGI